AAGGRPARGRGGAGAPPPPPPPAPPPPGGGGGGGGGARARSPLVRRRPLESRLAGRSRLIEPSHGGGHRSIEDDLRILSRLAGDLDHGIAELVERLFRFRLRRLDHERLLDDEGEIGRGRVEAEI